MESSRRDGWIVVITAAFAVAAGGFIVASAEKSPEERCAELQETYTQNMKILDKTNETAEVKTPASVETKITDPKTGLVICHAGAATQYQRPVQ